MNEQNQKDAERWRWAVWTALAGLGLVVVGLSLFLPDKGTDALVRFVTVVVPVLIGSDAHVRHARIRSRGR